MAYTPKQAKRIRKQYRRIVGPKPKGPKTAEIRGRRGAVQRGDSSFVNKAGKVVPLTRKKKLKTMERVVASGKKPKSFKPPKTPISGMLPLPPKKLKPSKPKPPRKGKPVNRPLRKLGRGMARMVK